MSTTAMRLMPSPGSYEALRERCLRIANLDRGDERFCIQQIVGVLRDSLRDYPRSPLEQFLWPLARWAYAHAAMDREMELLRQRLHQVCQLQALVYMQAPPPVPPDTRSYWRRVRDAVLSFRRADSANGEPR